MDGPILDQHSPSKEFIDPTAVFNYDPLLGLDYTTPHSPFGSVNTLDLQQGSPRMSFETLNMPMNYYSPQPTYMSSPSARPYTPSDNGIYPAAVTTASAGELSSDSMRQPSPSFVLRHARRGSGTQSPLSSASGLAAVPRTTPRFAPVPTPAARPAARERRARRTKTIDEFGSDDEDEVEYTSNAANTDVRREEIRRQRIESEQRRRDELRDGYRRLKDALPVSNQKSSKVCLLDRATSHIKFLEMTSGQLQSRVQQAESEVARLRAFNEALMLRSTEMRNAAAAASGAAQTF